MLKRLFLVALATLLCISPASAQTVPKVTVFDIRVRNYSSTCAWITIYWGRIYTPWVIENAPPGRPRFLKPRQSDVFAVAFTNPTSVPLSAELKVRAEFTRNPDCSGGNIADHSQERKGLISDMSILVPRVPISVSLEGPPYRVSPLECQSRC